MLRSSVVSLVLGLAACSAATPRADLPPKVVPRQMARTRAPEPPWSREGAELVEVQPRQTGAVLLRGAKLLLGDGKSVERGHVLLVDGKIAAAGPGDGSAPDKARVIDVEGKVVTPGLIDTHSHIGVYPQPQARAHDDGNEATAPVAASVRALDAFWAHDPAIERAVAGGVTTIQVLPGSANLIGGRAVTLKLRRATTAAAMRFAGAPSGLKMACGENPKRVYGERKQAPSTRMGNLAGQREAFLAARRLRESWRTWRVAEQKRQDEFNEKRAEFAAKNQERSERQKWCEGQKERQKKRQCEAWQREWAKEKLEAPKLGDETLPPERDLGAETLAGVLEGKILLQVHCYRADDMMRMLALADEMGVSVRSFHHALDAYKIRDELVRRGIAVSTWADWWGFKLEAYDGIPENIALVESAGGRPVVHSDSPEGVQRLNQEAAKALWSGKHSGLAIDPARAITWVTHNPAWVLGVHDRVGTLASGKDADVVVWSGDPLSVYAKAELVFIDGVLRFDAKQAAPSSDYEVGP
ncbi:MAG: hypothetical protein AMXMBFR56_09970 [Polyangiaceae bacterium]